MMQALYYDRDGHPVSKERWQQLGRQPGYSRTGYADATRHGQQVTVITFWSGIAGDGPDGPLIFCTCTGIRAPGGPHPAYQRLWGWPDIAAARAGHHAVTAWIAGLADFLAGHADQLPRRTRPCPARPPRVKGGEPAMDDSLTIGVRPEPGYVIITAAGEIDIFTVARLRERLFTLASGGRPVIADLDRVTYLGAAGLGALAGAAHRTAASGASLHVVCARPQTRQLIQLTGLDRTLRLARTLNDALKDMPAAPAARLPQPVPAPANRW